MTQLSSGITKRGEGMWDRFMLVNLGTETEYHPALALPDYSNPVFFDAQTDYLAVEPDYAVNIDQLVDDSKLRVENGELEFLYNLDGMMGLRVQQSHPLPRPLHWFNRHIHQLLLVGSDLRGFAETGHYKVEAVEGRTWRQHLVAADLYKPTWDKNFKFMFQKDPNTGMDVLDSEGHRVFVGSQRFADGGLVVHVVQKHIPFTEMDAGRLGVQYTNVLKQKNHLVERLGKSEHRSKIAMSALKYMEELLVATLTSYGEFQKSSHKVKVKGIEYDMRDAVEMAQLVEGKVESMLSSDIIKKIKESGQAGKTLAFTSKDVVIPTEIMPELQEYKAKALSLQVTLQMMEDLGAQEVFAKGYIIDFVQWCTDMGYGGTLKRIVDNLPAHAPREVAQEKLVEIMSKMPPEPTRSKTKEKREGVLTRALKQLQSAEARAQVEEAAGEAGEE